MQVNVKLYKPHEAQEQILREAKRFNVLACGRRFGKSALAVNLLCEPAIHGFPVAYFTPTYKLLDGTYTECLQSLSPILKRKNDHQFIELITGGKIEFWSLENELAGRSRKYKRVILDEVAFAKNLWGLWTEAVRATLTDMRGDGWFLSTPKGKNDFQKMFLKGKTEENWMSWQMPTSANPFIDPLEIEDARKDLPELAFRQEYLAEFNEDIANPFGSTFIRQCTYPMSTQPPVVFGIDLAKSVDYTVIIGLDQAGCVCYFDRFQKDWRQTKETIKALPNVPKLIDSSGVGDPIVEDLIGEGVNAVGKKFTSSSKQQLMMGLASAIQQRKIQFPEGIITAELEIFEYQYSATGVKYSAPSGFHDDCVMALALAWEHKSKNVGSGKYSFA